MNRPGLLAGVSVAGALGLAALALTRLFPPWWGGAGYGFVCAVLFFIYILYLLACAKGRVGRLALGGGAFFLLTVTAALGIGWPGGVLMGAGLVFGVRSLLAYRSLIAVLCDAFLGLLALGWAQAALSLSGSFPWAVWCFFLAHALFPLIPEKAGLVPGAEAPGERDRFDRAHAAAEAAFRQLAGGP